MGAEEDLAAYLTRVGGGPMTGGGASAADPDDPPILFGRHTSTSSRQYDIGDGKKHTTTSKTKQPVTKTYSQMQREFYNLKPAELKALQEKLFAGGFYGSAKRDDVAWGSYDEDTFTAYTAALTRAARFKAAGVDVTFDEMLAQSKKPASAEKGEKKAPFQPQLTDPEDLKAVFKVAAQSVMGEFVSDAEVNQLVEAYRAKQLEAQQHDYNLTSNEIAGIQASVPNPQTFAEAQLRLKHPDQAGSHDMVGAYEAFHNLLGGRG